MLAALSAAQGSLAERIVRSLPADTLPAYIGYSGDMRLSVVVDQSGRR